jgi:predicted nucleic acid-binding protein
VILVDTSVWIAHLRWQLPDLSALLEQERVLTHPFVLGELACGWIGNRAAILQFLKELPASISASHEEVLHVIEDRKLWGRGIGLVDFHLLASAMLTGCQFWTSDRRLSELAAEFRVEWRPKVH